MQRVTRTRPVRPALLAIDPSLSSTGLAFRAPNGQIEAIRLQEPKLRGMERLEALQQKLSGAIQTINPIAVIYEDYAMNARGRNFDIGELGGIYRLLIWQMGIPRLDITPSTLKKVFTTKGNADKADMQKTLHVVHGVDYITNNDEVDAAALLLIGEAFHFNTGNKFLISRLDQALEQKKPGIYLTAGRSIGN